MKKWNKIEMKYTFYSPVNTQKAVDFSGNAEVQCLNLVNGCLYITYNNFCPNFLQFLCLD